MNQCHIHPFRAFHNLILLCTVISLVGCAKSEPPGTAENLKADYDRIVKERDQIKDDCKKQREDLERTWRQRVMDKENKITELTLDNANLRQRLLAAEGAVEEVPLVNSARDRSISWLHGTYWIIIFGFIAVLGVLMWVHANLRERVRMHIINNSQLIPSKEIIDVPTSKFN